MNINIHKEVPVYSKRDVFASRRGAELALEELKTAYAAKDHSNGMINYENTYDESDLDAEVFVVTESSQANKVLYAGN